MPIINLNQPADKIAEEAKNYYKTTMVACTGYNLPKVFNELAINLLENMKSVCEETDHYERDFNPKYISLSSALEILKKEIKQ